MNRSNMKWIDLVAEFINQTGKTVIEFHEHNAIAAIGGRLRVRRYLAKRGRRVKGKRKRWQLCHWTIWPDQIEAIAKATFANRGPHSLSAIDRKRPPFIAFWQKAKQ